MSASIKGIRYILSLLFLVVLLIAPYYRGLFFEQQLYGFELILLFLLLAATWIIDEDCLKQSMGHWRWTILLLPTVYIISVLAAASHEMAYQSVYRMWTSLAVYVIGAGLLVTPARRMAANIMLILTALWVAIFGWMNFFGWFKFRDAVLGNRLASVFQYPNTLAGFLSAFFIMGLIMASGKKWYAAFVGSFLAFVSGLSILVTYSRGGWLVWAVAYLLVMFFLPQRNQWRYFLYSLPVFAAMLLALPIMVAAQGSKNAGLFLLLLLNGIAAAFVNLVLQWMITKTGGKAIDVRPPWWKRLILPIVLILAAVLLSSLVLNSSALVEKLPDSIAKRVGDIQLETNSVLQRGIFTQDALKIFADNPVIGAGGGAWKALFQKYQDYPYWSTTTHNYWVQVLTETGLLGFAAFLSFLVVLAIGLFQRFRRADEEGKIRLVYYSAAIAVLLGHSFIDFNMSFGYYMMMVYLFFALLVKEMDNLSDEEQPKVLTAEALLKQKSVRASDGWASLIRWTGTTMSVLLIIGVSRYMIASAKYEKGIEMIQKGNNDGFDYVKQAASFNRSSFEYQRTYADLLYQAGQNNKNPRIIQESVARMEKAIALEPNNPQYLTQAAQFYARMGDGLKTLEMSKRAVESAPWNEAMRYNYMNVLYQIGISSLKENRPAVEVKGYFDTLLTQYEEVGKGVAHIQSLPPALEKGRPFRQTEGMKLLVGKTYYEQQQWQQLREMLLPLTKSKDANTQLEAAAYLVAGSQKERDLLTQQQLDEIQGLVKDQAQLQKQINDIQALPVISG